jgi:hypothetical protein
MKRETKVPHCTKIRKENTASFAGMLRSFCPMSKCAVEETGMNSVNPCMMPRRVAWRRVIVFCF